MARIPEEEITRIKQEVSLVRLVESSGIALTKKGKDWFGCCPFHDDKTPSLSITPDKNIWNCLGACQQGGDVFSWVEKMHGVSFTKAFHMLKEQSPSLAAGSGTVKNATTTKLETPFNIKADDQALLHQVVDYYHEGLKQNPEALAYLKKRGLNNSDMIDHFKLGFANRTLGYRLPKTNRKMGAAVRGALQRIGLMRNTGHEHFNGSIVFPITNEQGIISEVYGRKIRDDLRKGTPVHLYLPGSHTGIFNLAALVASKEIILCESIIDALTFWCAGYRNVTTSYGINGFTDELLNAFKQHKTERVLIAYDRDQAGEKATSDLAACLLKEGIDCYRIHFPKGMDANEYALSVQPASKSLGVCIRSALWLGQGDKPELKTIPAEVIEQTEIITLEDNTSVDVKTGEILDEKIITKEAAKKTKELLPPLAAVVEEQASPVVPPKTEIPAEVKEHEIILTFGDRRYRVRGLDKNLSVNQLKINILASRDEHLHVDTLDLYSAKPRYHFIKQTAMELGLSEDIIKNDIGKVLLKLEALQEENIKKELQPKDPVKLLDDAEKQAALNLLQQPNLLDQILLDYQRCGVVGEHNNKLVGYLAAVSRKLDKPLGVMVQSSSAAGKSSLMESVLAFMPEEDKVQYSAMTGQSLYYMENGDLRHKILSIAEEEGSEKASYALKLLQSEGKLKIASTGKDPQSGRLTTHEYEVEGPVMIFSTTTSIEPDEELMNRCIILGVDEGREQTRAIHEQQRLSRTLEGIVQKKQKQTLLNLHQNAQRLLKPLSVLNPYAQQLNFLDDRTRLRRDHEKYLTLIDTLALLHQYQRNIKQIVIDDETITYIEATLSDIETANKLANELLGKSLDELPPQTRRLLTQINKMVEQQSKALEINKTDYYFSRKALRSYTGMSDTQLRLHIGRLVDLEYLIVHRGERGQRFEYELLYDGEGQDGSSFLMGLINVAQLEAQPNNNEVTNKIASTVKSSRGKVDEIAPPSRPQNGPNAGDARHDKSSLKTIEIESLEKTNENAPESIYMEKNKNNGKNHHSVTSV